VTYSGTHYSTFGMKQYFDYSLEYFKRCLMSDAPFDLKPIDEWTDDPWFMDQNTRKPVKNEGWWVINEGQARGSILGGNLCTFNLLQGTEYMPDLDDTVLFIEDDAESLPHHFDRNLVSLIQQPGFEGIRAIVVGRFQQETKMSRELLAELIRTKKELTNLPIIANVDFGHTNQLITYPIGGKVEIVVDKTHPRITIAKH
jgi:muramoyltetrapeptide carboxypeptidase